MIKHGMNSECIKRREKKIRHDLKSAILLMKKMYLGSREFLILQSQLGIYDVKCICH